MVITFTGHRPQKLGGYDYDNDTNSIIKNFFGYSITHIYCTNPETDLHFITGGALGFDQMMFDVCYRCKQIMQNNITIELAIPFKEQPKLWRYEDICRYEKHKRQADIVTYVDTVDGYKFSGVPIGKYHIEKMQLRNMYMVDKGDLLFSCWDGTKGGTCNCVNYAKKQKHITNVNYSPESILSSIPKNDDDDEIL